MTKFGDKTVLHVHVQVTSSFSQPLYFHDIFVTASPTKVNFYVQTPWKGEIKVCK